MERLPLSRILIALLLAIVLTGSRLHSQEDLAKARLRLVPVSGHVSMIVCDSAVAGNVGVSAGEDGVLIIDTQFPELVRQINSAIAQVHPGPVRIVLNTNWHHDHANGNELFARAGALIMAHERTRERMLSPQEFKEWEYTFPSAPRGALPAVLIQDSLTIHFNGDEMCILHLPGAHSDADLAFLFRKANVLHTGDLYFAQGYPFIDVGHGGSIDGMIAAADRLLAMTDAKTLIIPGHGPLSNRREYQEYRQMLAAVRDRVGKMVREGRTLQEVLSAHVNAEFDRGREKTILTGSELVEIVVREMTRK